MRLEEARGPVAAKATKPESEELRVLIEQWKKELEIGNQTEEGQSPNEESMQLSDFPATSYMYTHLSS